MRLALVFLACVFLLAGAEDRDRDGLSDDLEQTLLVQFAPTFYVSAKECAGAPAEFLPGSRVPKVVAKNGTIYGQVFGSGSLLEIHYYHLWSRDCGRIGHVLDAEHVSGLIRSDDAQQTTPEWKAVYWYAAAHQNTVCDASGSSAAAALPAKDHGPSVWISRGKHASFLSLDSCARGCGSDHCEQMSPLARGNLVNIGEPGAFMNGAVWAESNLWPLASKMKSDFDSAALAELQSSAGIVSLNSPRRSVQAVISASAAPIDALATGNRHTSSALSLAGKTTDGALNRSVKHVGKSLRVARRTVAGWLKMEGN